MTLAELPLAWKDRGACLALSRRDKRLFFSESYLDQDAAKRICRSPCPVQRECLAYALANHEPVGVWGGYTFTERCNIRSLGKATNPLFDAHQLEILRTYPDRLVEQARRTVAVVTDLPNFRVDVPNFKVAL